MDAAGARGAACRACGGALGAALELGAHPPCNRFLSSPGEVAPVFPLTPAVCERCGLLQLVAPAPASEVAPRWPWITYQEAEEHLDDLTASLVAAGAAGPGGVVGAISYKDASLLARLAARFDERWAVGPRDLGLDGARAEIDAVQDRLAGPALRALADRVPPADLLLARHVIEHAHDLPGFLGALRALTRPGGRVVLEVPDASGMVRLRDYSQLWEEHVSYFDAGTLAATLRRHGFEPESVRVYPYAFENAIVAVARVAERPPTRCQEHGASAEARAFLGDFGAVRARNQACVAGLRRAGGAVALMGAGHLSCTYVNLMKVAGLIDCVVDDDPMRRGLFMPGSGLPIAGSEALGARGVRLCLLGVNPRSEERVLARNVPFIAAGGVFRSIFPASPRALLREDLP